MSSNQPYKILNNGVKIPSFGLGVYLVEDDIATDNVYNALKIGYRLIDSAQAYENEEGTAKGIQKWLHEDPANRRREEVFFTTKIWDSNHGYENTIRSLNESLEKIGFLDYFDLVLLHSPQSNREGRLGTWKALQEFVQAGKVKSIGVSNYGIHHIQELLQWEDLKVKPVINQVEISPWLMREELVTYCRNNKIEVEAYSPLTRGNKFQEPSLVALVEKYNKDPAQILIRWSLQKGFIVLAKTTKLERLKSNFNVFNFEISKDDIDQLSHPGSYDYYSWDPVKYYK